MAEVLLLANPVCAERHGQTLGSLRAALEAVGLTTEAAWLGAGGHDDAMRVLLERVSPNMLVAAGGDGSVHQVANLAAPLALPVGVLPLGTANDFARSLSLPTELEAAVALLAEATPVGVDVGRVNGHYFLNAAHLGMGVEVARRTSPRLKRWVGPLAYGVAAYQAWREAEPVGIEVCLDDRRCVQMQASQLLVGNGRYFGGGLVVAHDATLQDGLLDVHVLGPELSAVDLLKLLAAARTGHLEDQHGLLYARAARLTARLSRPSDLNLDGELVRLGDELHFEVLPGALRVIAPAPVAATAAVAID